MIRQGESEVDYAKIDKVKSRMKILEDFTLLKELAEIPVTNETLDWRLFNIDYYSHDREFEEIEQILEENRDKLVDIRPYIIDTPHCAQSTDRLQKVLNVFRTMHLRTLPVVNPGTGKLEGVITRQDLFAYMGL